MFVVPFFSRISSWFGPRNINVAGASKYHKGIDIAAPAGTPVFAAQKGVVTIKESQKGYGNVVYISHPDGTETRYGHLSDFTDITPGMEIEAGTQIGFVGSTGVSSGAHLHFEVRVNGKAIDPSFILNDTAPTGGIYGSGQNAIANGGKFTSPLSDWDNIKAKLKAEEEKEKNIIAFAYRSTKKEDDFSSLFGSSPVGGVVSGVLKTLIGKGSLLGSLFNLNEPEQEKPAVALQLSKKDMRANGFTEEEITKIATLSQIKQQAPSSTLASAGQVISSNDLRNLGFDEIKIRQFDLLADQKQKLV